MRLFNAENDGSQIELDTIAKLMERRLDVMIRTVRKRLVPGKHFSETVSSEPSNGRPKKVILLTANGVRQLVMVLRGDRAETLRGYFALAERMWRNDSQDMIVNRRAREDPVDSAEKLKRQPVPAWVKLGHCVYVLNVADRSGVLKHKIGRSTVTCRK